MGTQRWRSFFARRRRAKPSPAAARQAEAEATEARHAEARSRPELAAKWEAQEPEPERWTEEELRIIGEVAEVEERGWTPRDAAYPAAEALVSKGVLRRSMWGQTPVYSATPSFRAKAALYLHRGEAARQAAEN